MPRALPGDLKVVLPQLEGGNPYMRLLSASLHEKGIDAEPLDGRRLPFLRMVFTEGPNTLIHLQWQHGLFLGRSWLSSVVRIGFFFAVMLSLKLRGVSFVWTVHNLVHHEGRFERLEMRASRLLARRVDKVVVHCAAAARKVAEEYRIDKERITIVPHGHYGSAYPPAIERLAARKELDLPEDDTLILFFGGIREYKGVSNLIDAFEGLESRNAHLAIVGKPTPASLGDSLFNRVRGKEKITLRLGHLDPETLVRFICAADVVALPYKDSLTSGASVLAATLARPVIAPRVGCLAEIPEAAALLYDADDDSGLQNVLTQSLGAPLDQMGESAFDHAMQYPWSVVAAKLVEVYVEALGSKHAS